MMTPLSGQGSPRRDDSFAVLAVGLFLVIIVWIVFGQTIRHGFINYDDGMYVYQNPDVLRDLPRREFDGLLPLLRSVIGIRSPGSRTCLTRPSGGAALADIILPMC